MRTMTLKPDEVRVADDGGSLEFDGIAVPYDHAIVYGGVQESFARGAFDAGEVPGTPILYGHDRGEQIGQIISADDTPVGLAITGRILAATNRGGDAIALMRDGALRGLSVGFEPVEAKATATGRQYTRALLHELSTTPLPAYGDKSTVTAVREEEEDMPDQNREAIDLAPITERIDQLEARMVQRTAPEPRTFGVVEAFAEQLRASKDSRQLRALADVVSQSNAGVLPPSWTSEVVGYVDSMRYLFANAGSIGFPATGHSLTVPSVAVHTTVAARGAEKTEIPSQALTTGSTTYQAAWYAGGVDVALEVIWQSDPSVWEIVVRDLLAQYAAATDQAATLAAETAGAPHGAALDLGSYAGFIADVIGVGEQIRAATGFFGDRLSLTTASYQTLLGLVDSDNRRLFATQGSTNADGSAALTANAINVGGVVAYHNPRAAEDMQYSEGTLRIAEKPPATLSTDNVALMGRDVGVLGAIITVPVYGGDGIVVYSAAAGQRAGDKK